MINESPEIIPVKDAISISDYFVPIKIHSGKADYHGKFSDHAIL
jgi:hypothetical protein